MAFKPKFLLILGAAQAKLSRGSNSSASSFHAALSCFVGDSNAGKGRVYGDPFVACLASRIVGVLESEGVKAACVLVEDMFVGKKPLTVPGARNATAAPPVKTPEKTTTTKQPPPAPPAATKATHTSKLPFDSVPSQILSLSVSNLKHPHSNPTINRGVALGYSQVNSGDLSSAFFTFEAIIKDDSKCAPALVGLGTVKAMAGELKEAEGLLEKATDAKSTMSDAWKRSGQVKAALGKSKEAMTCIRNAISLDSPKPDPDSFNQIGNLLYGSKKYGEAVKDGFERCLQELGNPTSDVDGEIGRRVGGGGLAGVYNMVGLCHCNMGNFEASFKAFNAAIRLDPKGREYRANLGQLLRDAGRGGEAVEAFEGAIEVDGGYAQGFHLGGLCLYGMGEIGRATSFFNNALSAIKNNPTAANNLNIPGLFHMLLVCSVGRGDYELALKYHVMVEKCVPEGEGGDKQMRVAQYSAYYNREVALHLWNLLDADVLGWELDDLVPEGVKEGWSKREKPKLHVKTNQTAELLGRVRGKVKCVGVGAPTIKFSDLPFADEATSYGSFVQLRSVGFLSNVRQHRQFGLAVLETSQFMTRNPDAGWRECFNVLVKWRQISEPNDPVWWIDKLGRKPFEEGFGLQTPLVAGELKVFRYYPYYEIAFRQLKKYCCVQCNLQNEEGKRVIECAKDLDELWNIVGEDFWVVLPCKMWRGGGEMEGTRLTLQKCRGKETAENVTVNTAEGYSFTIRTPSTPERFEKFERHFGVMWKSLGGRGERGAVEEALTIFYYWVCFAPLTRGSAAVGYGMLAAYLRTKGKRITKMPEGAQLDWEAILAENEEEFVGKWKEWAEGASVDVHGGGGGEGVAEALPTLRGRVEALM